MNKPTYAILNQADVQYEVNSMTLGTGMVWPTLFPLRNTLKFDLHALEGNEGLPISADRVAFNTKAPLKTRRKIGSWSGRLGKMAVSFDKDEVEINEYRDMETVMLANGGDTAQKQELLNYLFDDIDKCAKGMDAKVEIDALRIASHGKQTFPRSIEGDMATEDVIDFNIPTENFAGVGTDAKKWSNASGADGIKDIITAQKAIAKKGLAKPMYAIMEEAAFDNLCLQTATQKRIFPAAYAAKTLQGDEVDLAAVNSYMDRKGYPHILVIDSYALIEHKDASQETIKPWAENVVVLSPTQQLGYTYWKRVPTVQNTAAYQAQGSYYKITMYSDVNPMVEVTMAEAYYQPVLTNRKSLGYINTEAKAWNEGEVEA